MDEFLKSIKESASARLRSPIFGSYIISILIFNWKSIITILLSKKPIECTLEYVSYEYISFWTYLIYPLLTTSLIIIAPEYIYWVKEILQIKAFKGRSIILKQKKLDVILEEEELAVAKEKLSNAKAGERDKSALIQEIELLRTQLEERDNLIEKQNQAIKSSVNDASQDFLLSNRPSSKDLSLILLAKEILFEISQKGLKSNFLKLGKLITTEKSADGIEEPLKKILLQNKLIKRSKETSAPPSLTGRYDFTETGEYIWNYLVNNYESFN